MKLIHHWCIRFIKFFASATDKKWNYLDGMIEENLFNCERRWLWTIFDPSQFYDMSEFKIMKP